MAAYEPSPELPSRDAVLARAAASLDAWRARLPAARPRFLFTPETWSGLRGRYAVATGRKRSYFEAALAAARELAAAPVPAYRSPEEMMRAESGMTHFVAKQELWMRPVAEGIITLSFSLALTDDPAVRAKLRETVLTMCCYPQWGHNDDLAAGHTAHAVAIAYDWHPAIWSEEEKAFIRGVIRTRMEVMRAATYGGIYWAGHYGENHNHVSAGAVGMCGVVFLDEIPEAAEWTALGLTNFESVARACNPDGTSDEGVPYWSYGLAFILHYIEGTRHVLGTDALYASPAFRQYALSRAHSSTPDLDGVLPWGDAVPRDYYGPHYQLFRLAAEYRDPVGQFLGESLPFEPGSFTDKWVWTALWYDPTLEAPRSEGLDPHAPDGGIVTTRTGWGASDPLLAFKAGFTNRNHSHLDAGALALCFGHEWLLTTPGYGQGAGEPNFWEKDGGRWEFYSNATEGQATLLINSRNQRFTVDACGTIDAYASAREWCWASADLTGAYEDVVAVRRSILHRRGGYLLVFDEVRLAETGSVEWLAQVPPTAEIRDDDSLFVAGQSGSLEIVPFHPASLGFTLRAPTSPHLDVPATRMKTCALRQHGSFVRFAVALLPRTNGAARAPITFSRREIADGQEFLIEGPSWQDQVTLTCPPDLRPTVHAQHRVDGRIATAFTSASTVTE